MEGMEEEIKLQQLTELSSSAHLNISVQEEEPRRNSLIGATLDLLFTPIKKIFFREIKI
jgi:hypothetical protein